MTDYQITDEALESALREGYTGIQSIALQILSLNPTRVRMSNSGWVQVWEKKGDPKMRFRPLSSRSQRAAGLIILYIGRVTNGQVEVRTSPKLVGYDPAHLSHIATNMSPSNPDYHLVNEILQYAGSARSTESLLEDGVSFNEMEAPSSPPEEATDAPEKITYAPILTEDYLVEGAYTLEEKLVSSEDTTELLEDGRFKYNSVQIKELIIDYKDSISRDDWAEENRTTLTKKESAGTGI